MADSRVSTGIARRSERSSEPATITSGTAAKSVSYYGSSFSFDNTSAGGSVNFYIGGAVTESVADTTKNSVTTESRTIKYAGVSGSGYDDLGGLVLTGTIAATGKYSL